MSVLNGAHRAAEDSEQSRQTCATTLLVIFPLEGLLLPLLFFFTLRSVRTDLSDILLLFLKFIQNPCCTAFNTSASLAACQDFQPVTYYSFFKCADSVTACTAPLLWTENVLKLGYELTLSTNVFIFHGAHQNAFCQSLSDADFTIYPCSFYSIQFRSWLFSFHCFQQLIPSHGILQLLLYLLFPLTFPLLFFWAFHALNTSHIIGY